jgi:hypothetical protein
MQINVKIDFSKANKLLDRLRGPEVKQAIAKALTDSAFEGRRVVQQDMDKSFNGVTPYIRKSVFVTPATPNNLTAIIEPRYMGGKGVDPQNILRASIFGGERKLKRSEVAFLRAGILPAGYAIVPGDACPLDQYGNVRGGFVVQLISYLKAFGEQGYKANMSDKRKAKLANRGRTAGGYSRVNGVEYFVSYGKLRGGRGGSHLHPGIWSRTGTHGSDIKPILMFVKTPKYGKRLDFFDKPVKAALDKFNPRFRYHMRTILEAGA